MHASSCRCCLLPTGQTVLLLTLRTVAIHPASFVVVVGVVFCLLNKTVYGCGFSPVIVCSRIMLVVVVFYLLDKTVLWLKFQSFYCLQSCHALLLSLLLLFCIITLSSICRLLKKHPGHRRVKLTTATPL